MIDIWTGFMFAALFWKLAIQNGIKFFILMIHFYVFFYLAVHIDGFSFFLEEFPLLLVFRLGGIVQWCTAKLQRKDKSTSSSVPLR